MALVVCPECAKHVSELAEACPGCGYPIAKADREGETSENDEQQTKPGFWDCGGCSCFSVACLGALVIFIFVLIAGSGGRGSNSYSGSSGSGYSHIPATRYSTTIATRTGNTVADVDTAVEAGVQSLASMGVVSSQDELAGSMEVIATASREKVPLGQMVEMGVAAVKLTKAMSR